MRLAPDVEAERAVPDLIHRLRNPLAALSSGVSLVMYVARPTGETLELLQQMVGEISRLDAMTKDMQRYFAMTAGRPEAVAVAEAVGAARAAVEAAAARSGVEVVLEGDPNEHAKIDPAHLRFSVWELLSNAIRASERGSRVRVAWRKGRGRTERIAVEDGGEGIPSAHAGEIGKPFFTTHPERTGLGVATVARIARLAGGALRWGKVSGGGCRFVLELPAG